MKDFSLVPHYKKSEELVEILCKKTGNTDKLFFRVLVAYYFTKVASMMRCGIKTHDRGIIPVSIYALALANSGHGKGHATNIIEEQVIGQFRERFLEDTFMAISETSLAVLANRRAIKKNVDPDEELARTVKEFTNLGNLAFSFDSGTTAAVKQMRHKLLMAGAGSMNMEIDEIGSNLLGNLDVLTTFLELFDVGKVKQKLTKNTSENTRSEEIDGRTPTNMLLFGTPSKLLNGSKVEEEFYSMLETGYARRCLFGYVRTTEKHTGLTPDQIYDQLTDVTAENHLLLLSNAIAQLADVSYFNRTLSMSKPVSLFLIEYKLDCENLASKLAEHEEIRKAEISHRYFKALKLAGTYAFLDGSSSVEEEHLMSAIKLVEESGKAFSQILTRERNYVKLANYIANVGREVTHVDLVEDLPFYKGGEAQKRELMTLAIAYGYKNNIIIKKQYNDGIEFLIGESLATTNLDKMIISYGKELADNYLNELVEFDKLSKLTQLPNYHWVAHHLIDGYRREENCIAGFNMAVIDIDDTVSIDTVKLLLKDYTYLLYTTKRHTAQSNRFRVVLPLSHVLKLDPVDYKEFMSNIYEWLPFEVDTQTNQRSRKWLTNAGIHHYNQGKLLDALLFIPKTSKNEERKKVILDQTSLTNLERWFVNNTGTGNRSNQLIKYALLLVDSGMQIDSIRNNVLALNNKLADKMDDTEILSTIVVTAAKAIHKRDIEG
jgi:hypothetical protein